MAVDWLVKAGLDLTQIDNDIKQLQAKMQAAGIQLNKQGRLPGATGGTAAVSKSQKSQEAHEARILAIHSKYTATLAAEEDRLKRISLSRQRELEIAREIVKYRKSEGDSTSEALKQARQQIDLAKKLGREYAQQKSLAEDIARTKRQDAKDSAEAARKQLADQRRIQQEEQRYIAQGQRLDSRIVGTTARQRSATLGTADRKTIAAANLAAAKADVSTLTQALLTQQWNPKDAASLNKRLEEAEQRLVGARTQVEKLNRGFLGTGDNLGKILKKVTLWAIATGTVYTAVRGIENAMRSIAEVDFAKAGIAKVYRTKDANDIQSQRAAAEQLTTAAGPLAAAYGQPMLDVMKQMEGFARLGYKVNDIVKLTNASLLLQRAAGVDAADAIRLLTSTMNQYGLQVEDLNVQVNALNALENTTAARAKEIGEGVARAGAMAKSASVDLAELNSIIAILIETTGRPGSEVGRGVRTVFANLYSDEGVKDLQELGITVRGVNGDLKDGFTVIQELAARWSGLTDAQKQNIAATIAGKRQLDVFFGMMNQFPKIIDGITNQYKGLNSAMQEAALMQDTVHGQVQRLQATWTALVAGKGSGGLAETMKDLVSSLVWAIDNINKLDADKLKLLLTLLGGAGGALAGAKVSKNIYSIGAGALLGLASSYLLLKNQADNTNKTIEDTVNKLREAGGEESLTPLEMKMMSVDEVTQSLGRRITYAIEQMKTLDERNMSAAEKEKARLTIVAGLGEAYKEVQVTAAKAGTEEASKLTSIISLQRLQTGSIKDTITAMGQQKIALDKYHRSMLEWEKMQASKEKVALNTQIRELRNQESLTTVEGSPGLTTRERLSGVLARMIWPDDVSLADADKRVRAENYRLRRQELKESIADREAQLRVANAKVSAIESILNMRTDTTDMAQPPQILQEKKKVQTPGYPSISREEMPKLPQGGQVVDLSSYQRIAGYQFDVPSLLAALGQGIKQRNPFEQRVSALTALIQERSASPLIRQYNQLLRQAQDAEARDVGVRTGGIAPATVTAGNRVLGNVPGLPAPSLSTRPESLAATVAANKAKRALRAFLDKHGEDTGLNQYIQAKSELSELSESRRKFIGVTVNGKMYSPADFMDGAKVDAKTFEEYVKQWVEATDAYESLLDSIGSAIEDTGSMQYSDESIRSAKEKAESLRLAANEYKQKYGTIDSDSVNTSAIMGLLNTLTASIDLAATVAGGAEGLAGFKETQEKWRGLATMRADGSPAEFLRLLPGLINVALPQMWDGIDASEVKKTASLIGSLDPMRDAEAIQDAWQAVNVIAMGISTLSELPIDPGDTNLAALRESITQDVRGGFGRLSGLTGLVGQRRVEVYQSLFDQAKGTAVTGRISAMRGVEGQLAAAIAGETTGSETFNALQQLLQSVNTVIDETVAELIKNNAEALTKNIDKIQSDLEQSLALAEQQPFAEGSKARLAAIRAAIDAEVAIQDVITAAMLNVEGRGTEPYYEELYRLAEMQEQSRGRRDLRAREFNKAVTEARVPLEMLLSGQVGDKRYAPKALLDLQKQQEDLTAAAGRIGMSAYDQEAAELKARGVELVAAYLDEVMQYLMGTDASPAEVESALDKARVVAEKKVADLSQQALDNRRKQFLFDQRESNAAFGREINYSGRMAQLTGRDDWESFIIAKQIELEQRKYEVEHQYRDANYKDSEEYAERIRLLELQTQQEIAAAWRERLLSVRQMYREALGSLLMDFTDIKSIFDQLSRKAISDAIMRLVDNWKPLASIVNGAARMDTEYVAGYGQARLPSVAVGSAGGIGGANAITRSVSSKTTGGVFGKGPKTAVPVSIVNIATKQAMPIAVGGGGTYNASPKLGGNGLLQQVLAGYGILSGGFQAGQAGNGMGMFGSALSGAAAGMSFGGPIGAAIGGGLGLIGGLFGGLFKKKSRPQQQSDPIQLPTSADIQFAAPVTMPRSAYLGGRAGGGTTNTNYTTVEKIEVILPNVRNPEDARVAGEAFASALPSNVAELRQSRRRQVTVRM